MVYPTEVHHNGTTRVIWGPEEHAQARKDGWTDDLQNGQAELPPIVTAPRRFPVEVYRLGVTRVIWGPEEHEAARLEGFTDENALVSAGELMLRGMAKEVAKRGPGRPPKAPIDSVTV